MPFSLEQGTEIIKTAALLGAGFWGAWTFYKLQRIRAAQLGIEKSRMDQEEARQRLLAQQPQPHITLLIKEVRTPSKNCLLITVSVTNEGQQNFEMYFDTSTITVARIIINEDNSPTFERVRHAGPPMYLRPGDLAPEPLKQRGFRVGATRQHTFLLPVSEVGCYLVQFYATYRAIPFERDEQDSGNGELIVALEQMIYCTTGKPGNAARAQPENGTFAQRRTAEKRSAFPPSIEQ